MPAMPDSSVSKFTAPEKPDDSMDPEAQESDEGENYSDPDSSMEPAIMLSQAQADAAGMSGAMPGDKFTVGVTVANQADDGWNVQLDPGSAVKMEGPSADQTDEDPMATKRGNASVKGPEDFGMPTGLGTSPTILNT